MARKLRIEFSGACYHVFNRGNYRRELFGQSDAADSFQHCLDQACVSFGWIVHAFTIMPNHFHLAVETPEPNLSWGMKWLQGTWAQRFNRFRSEIGRPFQGRYRAKPVEPGHALAQVAHYIHLNPLRKGMVTANRMGTYRWSSLALFPRKDRPAWLEPATVLAESGRLPDTAAGWRRYCAYIAQLAEKEPRIRDETFATLAATWAIGSTAFRAQVRHELVNEGGRAGRFLLLGADSAAVRSARMELWEEQLRRIARAFRTNLKCLPPLKSAVEKIRIAAVMRRTTSVSNAWLAQRLSMGAASSIGSLLHRFQASGGADEPTYRRILSRIQT